MEKGKHSLEVMIMAQEGKKGLSYVVAAFAAWGVLPVYWKLMAGVPAAEILAHRVVWSLVFVAALLFLAAGRRAKLGAILRDGKKRLYFPATAVLIGANWFLYIHAVNSGHIVESSLGYYITPLLNVLLGLVFLRERLRPAQILALALAAAGVIIRTIQYGSVPWISLGLALTFSLYGLLKKAADLDGISGLFLETAVLAPLALGFIIFWQARGEGSFAAAGVPTSLLLAGAGVVTATPLLWFAEGARRVTLTTVGFAQYLSPTLSLALGVLLYREPFSGWHAVSFGFIWCALAVYSLSQARQFGAPARAARNCCEP
ncbi:MAG: EamA family transporter RarD [Patescibacteria group bacterium]